MSNHISRRDFVRYSVGSAGLALLHNSTLLGAAAPSNRLVVGVMGTSGRGTELARGFARNAGSRVKYVCDVDQANAAAAAKAVATLQDQSIQPVGDFRRILDDKEVDILVIATPDHWHAPAAILACSAGKHVYVEKPCSHNPREGEILVAAARKHNRVVQHGTQRRNWPGNAEAIKKVHEGAIGKVRFSRGWYNNNRAETGRGNEVPVPPRLNWDLWQGPAPRKSFKDNYVHYKWHWFWHWGTGECGNNGIHALDMCRWGLQVDHPTRVTAGGGRYHFDDDQETPDTHIVSYDFGDKMIAWEGRSCQPRGFEGGGGFGFAFYGDQGSIVVASNGYIQYDNKNKEVVNKDGVGGDAPHIEDFLNAIRTSTRPAADIEDGHKSTMLCHLGNIAWRTGRTINLDPKTHTIANDPDAMKLWGREYEKGWTPAVG